MKILALSLFIATGPVWAENSVQPISAPDTVYQSIFADYRPIQDEPILEWRSINDEMGRLRGHIGHLGEAPALQQNEAGHVNHGTTKPQGEKERP